MRYAALASDYDGTIAEDGVVAESTIKALEEVRASGRRLILVTGRELPDLQKVFSRLDLFERVVAENGALLYEPATRCKRLLTQAPPPEFVETLRRRGVSNLSVGDVIVAMWHPDETHAIETIRDLGLELQVIFNKDAVMVLPSGVNKSTGLMAALRELGISRHNVVGVGDAENDHAFLNCCECAVAVANAIPALKERADFTTRGERGNGVIELARALLDNDLAGQDTKAERHMIRAGTADSRDILLKPWDSAILICGHSGGGKSTLVTALVEQIKDQHYQICLFDPEGDYSELPGFVATGDAGHEPSLDHLARYLDDPLAQIALNLTGVGMADRAKIFGSALMVIEERRTRAGRPHWLIIDEAHHMLPSEWAAGSEVSTGKPVNVILVTVKPEHVSPAALKRINTVIVVGRDPRSTFEGFARSIERQAPPIPAEDLPTGEALIWFPDGDSAPVRMKAVRSTVELKRHKRKYAEGELEEERMFTFRGPDGKLNLRTRNLLMFIDLAKGIDDETWMFHLKERDYSQWFREAIKDEDLAGEASKVENNSRVSPAESRREIITAIERRYTGAT